MKRFSYPIAILLMLCALQYSIGQVIRVPADYPTIQQGIDASSPGDTVLVDRGTYVENIDFKGKLITLASHFILDKNTTHIANTIIDGSEPADADKGAVVTMEGIVDTMAVLTGFSITGGTGNVGELIVYSNKIADICTGGGVYCSGGKIEYNYIFDNHILDHTDLMAMGGGIGQMPSEVSDVNLIVRKNMVYNNTIRSKTYAQGGGVAVGNDDGLTLVEYNDIYNNTSECTGAWKANAGGLLVGNTSPWEGDLIVRNNRIVDNEIIGKRGQGAGIFVTITPNPHEYQDAAARMSFYNNIIAFNSSTDAAGGMAFWDQKAYPWEHPAMFICNNTFYKNRADRVAGIYNHNGLMLLMNNIIWDDLSEKGNIEELSCEKLYIIFANSGKFVCMKNVVQNTDHPNNCPDAPFFVDAQSFRLNESGAGVDFGMDSYFYHGEPFVAPRVDFYGEQRQDGRIDAGAVQTSGVTSDFVGTAIPGDEKFRVYPNPFSDHFTIGTAGEETVRSVAMYNMRGQLIQRIDSPGQDQLTIRRGTLPPGIYFLRIEGDQVYTRKIVAR